MSFIKKLFLERLPKLYSFISGLGFSKSLIVSDLEKRIPNAILSTTMLFLFALILPKAPQAGESNLRELKTLLQGNMGREATVIVFLGVGCPIANKYLPRLNEMAQAYANQGARFVGFNSNANETALQVANHAKEYGIAFESLKDVNHKAADYFQASHTPQTFVLDKTGTIVYQGRIDDQHNYRGASAPKIHESDLENALNAVLKGEKVKEPVTKVLGCAISRDYKNPVDVTYAKEISRIIQNRCQECHRPNAVAEFYPWMTYDDVKAMSKTIKDVVVDRRMPPWHADPKYGEFSNDRGLTEDEMNAIATWVDANAPEGDNAHAPDPVVYSKSEWTIGEPDQILTIPEPFDVPAQGVIDYQYQTIEAPIEKDLWFEKAQIIFDTPAVHHIILYSIPPGKKPEEREWLFGAAPGDKAVEYPEGFARKIAAGSRIMFELHYTTTGRAVTDRSYAGLVFANENLFANGKPSHEVVMAPLGDIWLDIAAGDPNFGYERSYHVQKDLYAMSFFPHMHYRGKSFEYQVIYPDGKRETVLSVPKYDFNWQSNYVYAKPLFLPKGSTIVTIAHWDNSENNPYNPDPTKNVGFGLQSWDEMMFGFMDYYVADGQPADGAAVKADPNNIPQDVRNERKERREGRKTERASS